MALKKEAAGIWEWSIRVTDDSSKVLVPEEGLACRLFLGLKGLLTRLFLRLSKFLQNAWNIGCNDPRKVIHCLKVGMALTAVSIFYYMRPLYEGVGGNAMWAVMTVVVVFENTVGATLCKCLNRVCGTFLAGFIAVGVHWIASQSGEKFEPFIVGVSVFVLASAATFSRFIPSIKARFDYGTMIFILTFSLVSVSGYRVDKLFDMAHQRLSTIIIGTSLCIVIIMIICPIWAGQELYMLITRNMDKLANSLDGCVAEYFGSSEGTTGSNKEADKNLLGYKCVLSSKATEETMANFARWEPAHGRFNFRHPWNQYLKIGAAMRSCAYCIEALNGCINSENKAPEHLKKRISKICTEVSSNSSSVIKELATVIKTMKKSSSVDFLVGQMNSAVQELQNDLKSLPGLFIPQTLPEAGTPHEKTTEANLTGAAAASILPVPLMEVIPLVTLASLLIEITTRIEGIVDAVEKLADLAHFQPVADEKIKKDNKIVQDQRKEDEPMRTLQRV
ncbi:Aluminum-activated malate transporter [Trema orientale]|uniref:Aluminum-activated malate transporter n=1 Tax=Trema orientale TaxID=63057 RepID=A0A2P5F4W3_TREOI|nr:Aluminum-activated malate transporter [Trema orientale]